MNSFTVHLAVAFCFSLNDFNWLKMPITWLSLLYLALSFSTYCSKSWTLKLAIFLWSFPSSGNALSKNFFASLTLGFFITSYIVSADYLTELPYIISEGCWLLISCLATTCCRNKRRKGKDSSWAEEKQNSPRCRPLSKYKV